MKRKLDKESAAEVDKLWAELFEITKNPRPPSEWPEGAKRIDFVQRIILESFAFGNYEFSEVMAHAKTKLGTLLPEYLKDFKFVYGAISADISDEKFNKMDDSKTVRAFKLNITNE